MILHVLWGAFWQPQSGFSLKAGLPRSMPNADQCRSKSEMPLNANHCWSMSINSDRFLSMRSMPIDRHSEELIGIDQHWSELIDIGINVRILIGIGHWWRESCVSYTCTKSIESTGLSLTMLTSLVKDAFYSFQGCCIVSLIVTLWYIVGQWFLAV